MTCNSGYLSGLRDAQGNYIGFMVNGTDEAVGIVSMAALADDYVADTNSPDGTFRIAVETVGTIEVELSDGTNFTVTTVMATKYEGDWLPLNIRKVYKVGTTATFLVGW